MQPKHEYILRLLAEAKLITDSQVDGALSTFSSGEDPLQTLIRTSAISELDVSRALAAKANMRWIDLSSTLIPPDAINRVPASDAWKLQVIPINVGDTGLTIAIGDPLDIDLIDSLSFLLRREIEPVCTTPAKIREALIKYYGPATQSSDTSSNRLEATMREPTNLSPEHPAVDPLLTGNSNEAPIVQLVSMLLSEAHRLGASDIHLEPLAEKLQVRFRIDGVLREMPAPQRRLHPAIVSRLKIMTGSMSIAEKRLPQDGRIHVNLRDNLVDLRVSTIPTHHGESVVMRVLDKSNLMLGLPELGFLSDDQETLQRLIGLPDGIILVTGPTGSGKTSTLYSFLNLLNQSDRKIITVEEPVEYQISGINQVQVNSQIGMTFPLALRSILRQAPNIIMIGEIRDRETATIAINASLTGHLVFSTLHTNDAPSAIARLLDIGVQPFLVASSLRAIIAQRLVRRLCPDCVNQNNDHTPKSVGCEKCGGTAYKGRTGIFEIFSIDDEARHLINQRSSTGSLRRHARGHGMRTLREDGMRKAFVGLTSVEEVLSTTIEVVE